MALLKTGLGVSLWVLFYTVLSSRLRDVAYARALYVVRSRLTEIIDANPPRTEL